MKTIVEFIQKIIHDLNLGSLAPGVQKALELRIGEIVDEQIESALALSLTEEDWKVYDAYLLAHPGAQTRDAMQAMVARRPEIESAVERALVSSYDDVMAREAAARFSQ